jgi:hypothetical protein
MCGDRWLQELEDSPVPRNYRDAYAKAAAMMAGRTPQIDAETAGVAYTDLGEGRGRFDIPLLNRMYELSWPDLAMREQGCDVEPSHVLQILLLHYLVVSDGIAIRGQWTSFREIPDGRIYYPAFRGGSEQRLLGRFGQDVAAFHAAAAALGGRPLELADHAYAFDLLPRLPMAVLLWEGDDEFPPELHILMDSTAANYLPTEDIAVISRYLAISLLRAVPR